MFYILNTYAYDAQKIFHGLLKSKSFPKIHTFCLWSFAKLQNILSFCVSFWQRFWLQKPVENFLCAVCIHSEYVKRSPISEECNARWIMTVRPSKHFSLKEKWLSSEFLKFESLKLCQASEYSTILCEFLAKTLTSEALRKFSMGRRHKFWVCKTFS